MFLVLAFWDAAIEMLKQVLCFRQIGIEFEHAQNRIARSTGLSSATKYPSEIHSNAALARSAPEGILPEADSLAKMSAVGFDCS